MLRGPLRAALLANAASDGAGNPILPAYAETLRQLTPMEAQILDWLAEHSVDWPKLELGVASESELLDTFSLSQDQYALLASDLSRLELVAVRERGRPLSTSVDESGNVHTEFDQYLESRLTVLGRCFLEACSPPALMESAPSGPTVTQD